MTDGILIWMILFGIFAFIFFSIAAVVAVKGVSDIKEIMNDPELNNHD
ncbi:hypothetical protein [Balneola sp. EhC07]|nr:hypothetical protein [Balneola sp. EhC07]